MNWAYGSFQNSPCGAEPARGLSAVIRAMTPAKSSGASDAVPPSIAALGSAMEGDAGGAGGEGGAPASIAGSEVGGGAGGALGGPGGTAGADGGAPPDEPAGFSRGAPCSIQRRISSTCSAVGF